MKTFALQKRILEEFNPWWLREKVDPELALPFKREIYKEIENSLEKRFILALMGLRRVGKTTVLYQLIEKILAQKTAPKQILFFSFDEGSHSVTKVIETYKEHHQINFREQRVYIFLDEVQKCSTWTNEVKKYYDLYPKIKFILTGSESLLLKKKTKESLAGRMFEFFFPPFRFPEFLQIKNVPEEKWKYETRIMPFFLEYMKRGGFPETFDLETEKEFKEYVRSLVVDKIVYKDIPKIFHIDEPDFLLMLLELICSHPGMDIDYQSLSRQLGKDRRVIKDYLFYLQQSFLIRLLGNYRKGKIATLRKKKKAYPCDTGLIYLYHSQQDDTFVGKVAETVVANKIAASFFWKNGREVDFIDNGMPIEVKYQEQITAEDSRAVREVMKKFNITKGIILTKSTEKETVFEEGRILFIPLWKWALENHKQ